MDITDPLEAELELIRSSLLPVETLTSSDSGRWPRIIDIDNDDTKLSLHVSVAEGYPAAGVVDLEVKGKKIGREEAESWRKWVKEKMGEWNLEDE